MSKYLKLFQNHSEYEAEVESGLILPNVSYCVANNHVHYNPKSGYYPGCEDGYPMEGEYDLDGGYFS